MIKLYNEPLLAILLLVCTINSYAQASVLKSTKISYNNGEYLNVEAFIEIDLENLRLDMLIIDLEDNVENQHEKFAIKGVTYRYDSTKKIQYFLKRSSKDFEELITIDSEKKIITFENRDTVVRFKIND